MDKSSLLVPVQSYMILQYTCEIYIALYMYTKFAYQYTGTSVDQFKTKLWIQCCSLGETC